jgi:hypothetical protein
MWPGAGASRPSFYLEKRINEKWIPGYAPNCQAIHICEPFYVASGAVYTDTLTIHTAPNFRRSVFKVEEVPGTYWLVYEMYRNRGPDDRGGEVLPKEASISNEFRSTP